MRSSKGRDRQSKRAVEKWERAERETRDSDVQKNALASISATNFRTEAPQN